MMTLYKILFFLSQLFAMLHFDSISSNLYLKFNILALFSHSPWCVLCGVLHIPANSCFENRSIHCNRLKWIKTITRLGLTWLDSMMIRKTKEFCFCSQFNWFFLFDSFNFVFQLNNSFRCFWTIWIYNGISFIQSNYYWIINIIWIRGRENWILSQILLVHSLINWFWMGNNFTGRLTKQTKQTIETEVSNGKRKRMHQSQFQFIVHRSSFVDKW